MYNFIKIPSDKFLSLLVALFPLSFILGNLSININILLIIFITLIYHGKKIFKIRYFFFDKLLFSFFFLIIFTAVLNDIEFFIDNAYPKGINSTIKSLFFLKYLFLYLSLRYLLENNFLKLKFFFISCSFFSLFVSFDLIFQYFNGQDIFGYKADANAGTYGTGGKLGGPFGDEYIAGGYLQRFSFFTFFLTTLFIKKLDNNYGKVLIIFSAIVFFSAIMLSGNRMPTLLFIMLILLTLVFNKNLRKFILPSIFLFTVIFYTFYKQDLTTRVYFDKFYTQVSNMVDPIIRQDFYNKKNPVYLKEFVSFYDTWLLNKYVGGGIKNFRYYCHKRSNIDTSRPIVCNMHPHNYYLEILTETGVVGFAICVLIFLNILYISFIRKYFLKSNLNINKIIVPFIFLFIIEIFPIRSTGSFFTTGVATYFFLIVSIIIGIVRKENNIDNIVQKDKLY